MEKVPLEHIAADFLEAMLAVPVWRRAATTLQRTYSAKGMEYEKLGESDSCLFLCIDELGRDIGSVSYIGENKAAQEIRFSFMFEESALKMKEPELRRFITYCRNLDYAVADLRRKKRLEAKKDGIFVARTFTSAELDKEWPASVKKYADNMPAANNSTNQLTQAEESVREQRMRYSRQIL